MADNDALEFVVTVTSLIIFAEAVGTVVLVWRMRKKVPRPSRLPLIMTAVVAVLVAIFALATDTGLLPVSVNPINVSIVRSLIALLMGLPIWVMLAMYDVRCDDCPIIGRLPPNVSHKS